MASERAERAILDAAEAYRLVEEVNLLRARAETAEAQLAAVTAERDAWLEAAADLTARLMQEGEQLAAVTAELAESTARHQKDTIIADTIIKANAEDYADLEDERDSLREQMAAGAERVALLEAALTKLNEIRDGCVRTQRVTWSSLVYPLVAILNEAGFKTTVTDEELDRLFPSKAPAAEARVRALEAALADLIAAFTLHREATHKVKPNYCETCQEGTAALTQARGILAAVPGADRAEARVRALEATLREIEAETDYWANSALSSVGEGMVHRHYRELAREALAAAPGAAGPSAGDACGRRMLTEAEARPFGGVYRCHLDDRVWHAKALPAEAGPSAGEAK